jgi:hypothetical protein
MLLLATVSLSARGRKTGRILDEGKQLYRLERASWHGTDILMEMFPERASVPGGQLSYFDEEGRAVNIFWHKGNPSQIVWRLRFDDPSHTFASEIDTLGGAASPEELGLINMIEDAKRMVRENKDDFFSFYQNTSLNFIPLVDGGRRNVFVITAPHSHGVVLLGNDYRLTYDKKNRLKKKEKLHNGLITLQARSGEQDKPIEATMHSHVLSELITSTDICTLLLYRDFVEWRQHYVIGKEYVSVFNLDTEDVATITTEAFKNGPKRRGE